MSVEGTTKVAHRVARWEIAASDLKTTSAFYADLFGWKTTPSENRRFHVVDTGNGIGGIIFKAEDGLPTFVTFYVEVPDVEAALERAEGLGATTYVPPTPSPVAGERFFGVFGDPEGNLVGLVQR